MINFIKPEKRKRTIRPWMFVGISFVFVSIVAVSGAFFFLKQQTTSNIVFELQPREAHATEINSDATFLLKSSKPIVPKILKEHISIEPAISFELKQLTDDKKSFEVIPSDPLKKETVYAIAVESPIAERTQSWAYQVKAPFQIIGTIPGTEATGVPLNSGIEIAFNREVSPENQTFFEITPSLPVKIEYRGKKVAIVPQEPFKKKMVYSVSLKKEMLARDSTDTLSIDYRFIFETEDPSENVQSDKPSFSFSAPLIDFVPGGEPVFEVYAEKIKDLPVRIYRFTDGEEFTASYHSRIEGPLAWTRYQKRIDMPAKNLFFQSDVRIEKQNDLEFVRIPKKLEEGLYAMEAIINNKAVDSVYFQISPFLGAGTITQTKSLVWLKDAVSKDGIVGAKISFGKTVVASTDQDGIAFFDMPSSGDDEEENVGTSFLRVTKGGHTLFLSLSDGYGSAAGASEHWWTALTVDRPIYLPSDSIDYWGVLKRRDGTGIEGNTIKVRLRDPYSYDDTNPVYAEQEMNLSSFSTFSGNLPFSSLRPGYYELAIMYDNEVIMTQGITVQTFVKPAYYFTLTPERKAAFEREQVKFSVTARFYDGTPVAHLETAYYESSDGERESHKKLTLDDNGEGSFSLAMPKISSTGDPWYFSVTVEPAIAEEGDINDSAAVLVFPARAHLSVESAHRDTSADFAIQVRGVDLATEQNEEDPFIDSYLAGPLSHIPIDVTVTRITYKEKLVERKYDPFSKTTYPIYSHTEIRTPVEQKKLTTDTQGKAVFLWKGEDHEFYEVQFKLKDEKGVSIQEERSVYGILSSFRDSLELGIDLKNDDPDKYSYKIGDPISLTLQRSDGTALPPSKNRFLFLQGVNGLLSYRVSDAPQYRDAFKESYIPNSEVVGMWFQGSRFYRTQRWWFGSGGTNLPLDRRERQLSITLKKDKEHYRPRDEVQISLDVKDPNGKGRESEVNIVAIDKALSVFGDHSEEVLSQLYRDIETQWNFFMSHHHPLETLAEGGGCFLGGTSILTPQGERPIEKIRTGTTILTRASENSRENVQATVTKATSHTAYEVIVLNGKTRLTPNHRIWTNESWQPAGSIRVGDILLSQDGKEERVKSIERKREQHRVYNIEVSPFHTFFADGFYVHNQEKGGGGEGGALRSQFKDTALARTIQTDKEGNARLTFQLPDNLTSWILNVQAVTKDLFAGTIQHSIPVGLPFFVDATLNKTYLVGDDVIIRLRVFGQATIPQRVSYTISSETLPFKTIMREGGKQFDIPLEDLPEGRHAITITAKAGVYRDSMTREINVKKTYFTKNVSRFRELVKGNQYGIDEKGENTILVTFCSCDRQRYYPLLQELSYEGAVRGDDRLASILAKSLLKSYFGYSDELPDEDVTQFQDSGGSLRLLPYADGELELTALGAYALMFEKRILVNKDTLKEYLYSSLTNEKADTERSASALLGLSAFRAPILNEIHSLKQSRDLSLRGRAALALALETLGAREEARQYYQETIRPFLIEQEPYLFIRDEKNFDQGLQGTSLLALLAIRMQDADAGALERYVMDTEEREAPIDLERALIAWHIIPTLSEEAGSVSINTAQGKKMLQLKKGVRTTIAIPPSESSQFNAHLTKGTAMMVTEYEKLADPTIIAKDTAIALERWYEVNGKRTETLHDGELVKVVLKPSFQAAARDGMYAVSDFLPSGLRIITGSVPAQIGEDEGDLEYPISVDGAKATFIVWKGVDQKFYYYARVISKGSYRVDPALMQSLDSHASITVSTPTRVEIQ